MYNEKKMSIDKNLIFDLGLHKGEDTEYYLKRGFKVVAVEADEELVKKNERYFSNYIKNENLVIIHGAINDSNSESVTFYKNTKKSVWGTVVKSWAERNATLGADSIEVSVKVVNLEQLFEKYGIPYYLKIDIEGMDLIALKTLFKCITRPKYISIESEKVDFEKLIEEFDVFESLGYDLFTLVQQSDVAKQRVPVNSTEGKAIKFSFKTGSSGLFGNDLNVKWLTKNEAINRYKFIFKLYKIFGDRSIFTKIYSLKIMKSILQRIIRKPLPGWYDTHAKLKD